MTPYGNQMGAGCQQCGCAMPSHQGQMAMGGQMWPGTYAQMGGQMWPGPYPQAGGPMWQGPSAQMTGQMGPGAYGQAGGMPGQYPGYGGFGMYGPPGGFQGLPQTPGFDPISQGWGLGGLRRWGGAYSPQFVMTGLPTDEEIAEMVYDAIDADPLVPYDADVNVDVDAGTVTLTGTVPSKQVKHAVGDDSWWIPGVDDIRNDLQVATRRGGREETEATRQRPTPQRARTERSERAAPSAAR